MPSDVTFNSALFFDVASMFDGASAYEPGRGKPDTSLLGRYGPPAELKRPQMPSTKMVGTAAWDATKALDASDQCRAVLDQLLRNSVISRLRLAHDTAPALSPPASAHPAKGSAGINSRDVEHLASVLCRGEQSEVDGCATALADRQTDADAMLLDLLPMVEARLAALALDTADAGEITLARWRLQDLIEQSMPRFQAAAQCASRRLRVLVGSPELSGQRLRLLVTSESLIRDGWDAWEQTQGGSDHLVDLVRADWFALAVIAFDSTATDSVASLIRAMRRASLNPGLRIMAVSAPLAKRPDRMARLGADAAAETIRHATIQARRLSLLMPVSI